MSPHSRRRINRAAILACTALGLVFSCAAPNPSASPTSERSRIEDALAGLNKGRGIGQVAVSPDGTHVAWTEGSRRGGEIVVAPIDDLRNTRPVTAAKPDEHCRENEIIWSPNSKYLAFFSDCARPDEQADLYLSHVDGTPARRLTVLNGYVNSPAFSPDGTRIAFLYVEGATRPAGALAAMKPPSGVIGEDGVEIQRVAVIPIDGSAPAAPAQVTPANLHAFEFDWAPYSDGFAYVAAAPPGENNWWTAKLYTETIGAPPHAILDPSTVDGSLHGLQVAVPRWSPDGKLIAFIGGLMSDQGSTGGDVWLVSADGGTPRDITEKRPTSPAWLTWDGNEHLYVTELAGGNSQLLHYHLQGDRISPASSVNFGSPVFSVPGTVGDGRLEMGLSSTTNHALFVFTASTFDRASEIYAAKPAVTMSSGLEGLVQLTHLNDGIEPAWGKSVSVSWKSDDFHVQGWLMLPKHYDRSKKYPLIVEVHGGPAAATTSHWSGGGGISAAAFSAMDYFVLQPNPRGSYGQGEAFTEANRKDFGYGDLRDILAGVDAVEAKYSIDPNRVGLTGWSYGGFMTMLSVTRTNRFKAAVAGAGISDWLSYYGENSIDEWMIPYFGASVYDDPAVYAKSSAITFIKEVHTPTLVVVGDRDGECPAPQSFEFWHALRAQNVPTELVVYPNEGHGFVDPEHSRDVMIRAVAWFDKYMPPT